MLPVPPQLVGAAFTVSEAEAAGVSRRALASRQYVGYGGGLYRTVSTPHSARLLLVGRLKQLPAGTVVSHLTALAVMGLQLGSPDVLHFSTNRRYRSTRPGMVVHRYLGLLRPTVRDGLPLTPPYRLFVDCGAVLNDRNLLRVGDWLVARSYVELEELRVFVETSHLDGVRRARRVAKLVSARVGSVRESDVRWHLNRAGLPAPEVNVDIHDDAGGWLARGDLVYRRWKVLVEYDGWQHERDAAQRQWDHLRREALEAAGWTVIVVTIADMKAPHLVAQRVRQALRRRGCPC